MPTSSSDPSVVRVPSSLLRTKLAPPPTRRVLVARPRLMTRLDAGLRGALTLVTAPAGFGKTTLLSNWQPVSPVAGEPAPVMAWLSLETEDDDPWRFVHHVVAALQTIRPEFGAAVLSMLDAAPAPGPSVLMQVLINELLETERPCVLLLDDYHVIQSEAIHAAMNLLLDHRPPSVHVVIASRTHPPLALARRRARGQLNELSATDLRFSADEASAFLRQVMELKLSDAETIALTDRTEGWAAGLQLAALSIRDAADQATFIADFAGSDRSIVDYLADEVLSRLPEARHGFLLQTALLDRLCAPLCDSLLVDDETIVGSLRGSQAILEGLERDNLFLIALDNQRYWYRYHHLFADLLRAQFAKTGGARIPILHQRAATWFEEEGLTVEAIRHRLAAADWPEAARLLDIHGPTVANRGEIQTVGEWLAELPEPVLRSRPNLAVLRAIICLFTNQLGAAEQSLQSVEEAQLTEADDRSSRLRLGQAATVRAGICHFSGNLAQAVALGQQALTLLPPDERLARPLARVIAAHAYLIDGDLTAPVEALVSELVEEMRRSASLVAYLGAVLNLAEFQALQGRLRRARTTYEETVQLAAEIGGLWSLRCYSSKGRLEEGADEEWRGATMRGIQRVLVVSAEQQQALEAGRDHDPRPYYRERCAALLKVKAGQSMRAVALRGVLKPRQPDTVRRWVDAYEAHGLAGLMQRPRRHRGFSPSAAGAPGGDGPASAAHLRAGDDPLAAD